ncbi:MAG: four helix bundle protein [Polyangiaceae bacterium]|nr:four helix bundle protein [Polyangiaceae bacterium]
MHAGGAHLLRHRQRWAGFHLPTASQKLRQRGACTPPSDGSSSNRSSPSSSPLVEAIRRKDRDLASQLARALTSVALNVAEGFGSEAGNARLRFHSALGSPYEAQAALRVSAAWGYVSHTDVGVGQEIRSERRARAPGSIRGDVRRFVPRPKEQPRSRIDPARASALDPARNEHRASLPGGASVERDGPDDRRIVHGIDLAGLGFDEQHRPGRHAPLEHGHDSVVKGSEPRVRNKQPVQPEDHAQVAQERGVTSIPRQRRQRRLPPHLRQARGDGAATRLGVWLS